MKPLLFMSDHGGDITSLLWGADDAEPGVDISHASIVTSDVNHFLKSSHDMSHTCRYLSKRSPGTMMQAMASR